MTQFEKLRQLEFMQRQVLINQNKYIITCLTEIIKDKTEDFSEIINMKILIDKLANISDNDYRIIWGLKI